MSTSVVKESFFLLSLMLIAVACGGAVSTPIGESADQSPGRGDGKGGGSGSGVAAKPITPNTDVEIELVRGDNALCLPQAIARDATTGLVGCRLLVALADVGDACTVHDGLVDLDAPTAAAFRSERSIPANLAVCEVVQLGPPPESCVASNEAGWCYVDGKAAGGDCNQALRFSPRGQPTPGALVAIACPR